MELSNVTYKPCRQVGALAMTRSVVGGSAVVTAMSLMPLAAKPLPCYGNTQSVNFALFFFFLC